MVELELCFRKLGFVFFFFYFLFFEIFDQNSIKLRKYSKSFQWVSMMLRAKEKI